MSAGRRQHDEAADGAVEDNDRTDSARLPSATEETLRSQRTSVWAGVQFMAHYNVTLFETVPLVIIV